ncbi:phage tail family protein [Arthrobacter sp. zg-Y20]|uniref:phage distal tail protein n=1 Tax=unclassified Arthrobacter TaxID=235627 RepID=UPI001D138F66|nr:MULTISPECIES: phage tail domain-containing protein [unclassified Arthrobacter]MCC3277536.1 phage tail family protein [Arthrobacter sp. zg-Y20]MDK1317694.1 phage tail family protein [Arthrobacter sp. zg.Y20]WIB07047.1 phage tail family protein [Arthrobacter sp. zg-Y20]
MVDIAWTTDRPRFSVTLPGMVLQGQAAESAPVAGVFSDLKGWWDPPSSRGTVTQRSYQHGGWADRAYYSPRVLVLEGSLFGDDPLAVRDAFEAFIGGLSINDLFPLVVTEGSLSRYAMVRLEEDPLVVWRGGGEATFNIQLIAPDYRRLSGTGPAPAYSLTVPLPRTQGGRVRPYTLPSTINATVVSGSVDVLNSGTAPAPVTVRFDGPVSGPTVRMPDGQWLSFDLDVLPGQSLVVDLDARTALLNGVSRRGTMRGRWLVFGPGSNTLTFDAASYDEAARMTVSWSDSWK